MTKLANWRQLLNSHIDANRTKPFEWFSHDCGAWAGSCIEVTTGFNPIAGKLKPYDDALGAVRSMKKAGFKTPEAMAAGLLGNPKPCVFAHAGDVVAADLAALGIAGEERRIGLSLGICTGAFCFFVSDDGLVELSTLQMKMAFDG